MIPNDESSIPSDKTGFCMKCWEPFMVCDCDGPEHAPCKLFCSFECFALGLAPIKQEGTNVHGSTSEHGV